MWAFGIALYKMCVAYAPTQFKGFSYGKPIALVTKLTFEIGIEPIPFHKRDWKYISPQIQDLIKRWLEFNPEDRISAHEALEHEALK